MSITLNRTHTKSLKVSQIAPSALPPQYCVDGVVASFGAIKLAPDESTADFSLSYVDEYSDGTSAEIFVNRNLMIICRRSAKSPPSEYSVIEVYCFDTTSPEVAFDDAVLVLLPFTNETFARDLRKEINKLKAVA
jgi:hypothetical protein